MPNTILQSLHRETYDGRKLATFLITILAWLVEDQEGVVEDDQMKSYMAFDLRMSFIEAHIVMSVLYRFKLLTIVATDRHAFLMVSDIGTAFYNQLVAETIIHRARDIKLADSYINGGKLPQVDRLRKFRDREEFRRRLDAWVQGKTMEAYHCPFCKAKVSPNDPDHDDVCRGF